MHPHDKELVHKSTDERLRFEEAFLRLTTAGRIQNLLDALKLSQADLARRLGKSQAWVSKVLSGRQNLTLDSLARIGFALGVRWDPEMHMAPREGTPAAEDPPLPQWVRRGNDIEFEEPDFVGSFERISPAAHPMQPAVRFEFGKEIVVNAREGLFGARHTSRDGGISPSRVGGGAGSALVANDGREPGADEGVGNGA